MTKILILMAALLATSPALAQKRGDVSAMLSNADANGDRTITRAEFQQSRLSRFEKADRNGDGSVSRDDFKRLARFRPEAVERLNALIAEADADGDGRVTRNEIADGPMPLFESADANDDGRIDPAELAAFKTKAAGFRKQR